MAGQIGKAFALLLAVSGPGLAQADQGLPRWAGPADPPTGPVAESARGSAARAELLDHLRPVLAYYLGAPLEFRVEWLRSDGALAFAQVTAQRPGGVPLVIEDAPIHLRDGVSADLIDGSRGAGPRIEAFLVRRGGQWQIVDFAVGATDAWFAGEPWCRTYGFGSVMPTGYCPAP